MNDSYQKNLDPEKSCDFVAKQNKKWPVVSFQPQSPTWDFDDNTCRYRDPDWRSLVEGQRMCNWCIPPKVKYDMMLYNNNLLLNVRNVYDYICYLCLQFIQWLYWNVMFTWYIHYVYIYICDILIIYHVFFSPANANTRICIQLATLYEAYVKISKYSYLI